VDGHGAGHLGRGIGLRLDCRLPDRTLLTIEPLAGSGARTLLARVVHAIPDNRGWLHGCDLAHQLSEEELHEWQSRQPDLTGVPSYGTPGGSGPEAGCGPLLPLFLPVIAVANLSR
jgi:hypothetical protein